MTSTPPLSQIGDPPWEIATKFPAQGSWTEADYFAFNSKRGIEFADGCVELLPMPTKLHQLIVGYLYRVIFAHVSGQDIGSVLLPGYRVQVAQGRYREPDLVVVLAENESRAGEQFTQAADLVVEVVSEDDPDRDWNTKRAEYAAAGIPEYWIADPRDQTLTVLTLPAGQNEYAEAGRYTRGQQAASVLLTGVQIDIDEVFSQV